MLSPPIEKPAPQAASTRVLRRSCECGGGKISSGPSAECERKKLRLQPRIEIGALDDPLEREADRAADAVIAGGGADFGRVPVTIPRRHSAPLPGAAEVPASVHRTLAEPGRPLDADVRRDLEPRFDRDFSQVRVHDGAAAGDSARAVGALAYTVANHIVFRPGRYAPRTTEGRRLFAHELAHVAQAPDGRSPRLRLQPDDKERPKRQADPPGKPGAPAKKPGCATFPGGSTDCVVDPQTGTPTGKVTQRVDETNPCTRPCVVEHEAVHVRQMKKLCPDLRDCYLAADRGTRDLAECVKMGMFGGDVRECEAYKVSVPCLEKRLKTAKACRSRENQAYGRRKLETSEKCFMAKYCGTAPKHGLLDSSSVDEAGAADLAGPAEPTADEESALA